MFWTKIDFFDTVDIKIDVPIEHRDISVSKSEAIALYRFVSSNRESIKKSLEIGCAYAFSAIHIMSASSPTSVHLAIDPFQSTAYENKGVQNIKKQELSSRFKLIEDYSQIVLPQLIQQKEKFDLIFIDGGHLYDEIFVDYYFSEKLLNVGGWIIFHDKWMRSTQLVASWCRNNIRNLEEVSLNNRNLVCFRKVKDKYERQWYDFHEFYTWSGIFSHSLFKLFHRYNWIHGLRSKIK